MKIDSLTPSASSTPSTAMRGTKDEFLKLFMAQLQNQDPLDPKTGADMVAQLAQMTAVEQAQQTNTQLSELIAAQASNASSSMSSLIGRTCDAAAGAFQLEKGGTVPPLEISATSPLKGASVVITDAQGKEIKRIPLTDGARTASIQWDGTDASGVAVASGTYSIQIDAGTTGGDITSSWRAVVDAVDLTADGTLLRMGGIRVAPGSIRSIGTTQEAP